MIRKLVILLTLVAVSLAALAVAPPDAKPDHLANEPGCYIAALNRVIPFGKAAAAADGCYQHVCHEKHVGIEHCGVAVASEPCKLVEDKTKPYPDCCPKADCPAA